MSDRKTTEAIQKIAGTWNKDHVTMVTCEVTAVDLSTRSCTCLPIGGTAITEIEGVQLMCIVDDGFLLIPALNSTVIVAISIKNNPFIVQYSEIDKALLVTLNGIQFQGGELGGLPVSEYVAIRLNLIENAFNQLNIKVNALAPTPVIPPLINTTTANIANNSITQGI